MSEETECEECSERDEEDDAKDGKDDVGHVVHVRTTNQNISAFMDVADNRKIMCFRCGQIGHARYQCMTYRIRMCPRGEECADEFCKYAHAESQLRRPWEARCVRVVKQGSAFICIGCNSREHTFRNCPMHKDLLIV